MSLNKLGVILFSSFLALATAPFATAQSPSQETTKKQTTTKSEKSTTTKQEAGKSTDTQTNKTTGKTESTTQATSDQKAAGADKSGTTTKDKSSTTKKTKKTSGVSHEKVRHVQSALKQQGFDPGPIDGIMGPMTMTALRNYQSHNGLKVTGTVTAETEKSLMTTATARSSNTTSSGDSYKSENLSQTPSTRESLGLGAQGPVSEPAEVRQVQQALTDLQYNPGEVNGMMTSQTQQAIREFQWLNDMPVTGNLDEPTHIAIVAQGIGTSNIQRAKPETTVEPQSQNRTERSTTSTTATPPYSSSSTPSSTKTSSSVSSSSSPNKDQTYDTRQDSSVKKDKDHVKTEAKAGKEYDKDHAERVEKAAAVLLDLTAASDKRIPNELLERAEAIAVIPNMIKGAFGIGGRFGKGVVSQRLDNGRWSSPAFLQIGGGSFGAQIGVTSTDLVLVFTDKKALNQLEGGKDLKLGADASVAAGPVGRSAEAGVNLKLDTAIYAYSRAKGLFAGVALDGAVLDIDNSANKKVYGVSDAKGILNGTVAANATVRPFMDALDKVVPKKHLSQK